MNSEGRRIHSEKDRRRIIGKTNRTGSTTMERDSHFEVYCRLNESIDNLPFRPLIVSVFALVCHEYPLVIMLQVIITPTLFELSFLLEHVMCRERINHACRSFLVWRIEKDRNRNKTNME